ncbi:MAG: 30S ribosomal protein S20, partial [Gemmatimonadota bacterium]
MPNIKSAKKRMKLSANARVRNRSERARIRTAIKRVREATAADVGTERLR